MSKLVAVVVIAAMVPVVTFADEAPAGVAPEAVAEEASEPEAAVEAEPASEPEPEPAVEEAPVTEPEPVAETEPEPVAETEPVAESEPEILDSLDTPENDNGDVASEPETVGDGLARPADDESAPVADDAPSPEDPAEEPIEDASKTRSGIEPLGIEPMDGDLIMITFYVGEATTGISLPEGTKIKDVPGEFAPPDASSWPNGALAFKGWFTTAGALATIDTDSPAEAIDIETDTTVLTEGMAFYAGFSYKYLIEYLNADGIAIQSEYILPGEAIPAFTNVAALSSPQGKVHTGWKDQDGNAFTQGATASRDLQLSPVFDDSYYVTFNSNGGAAVAYQIVQNGGKVTPPTLANKTGYTLAGWYKDDPEILWDFDTDTVTQDTTLHANWMPDPNQKFGYTIAVWVEKPKVVGTPSVPSDFSAIGNIIVNDTDNSAYKAAAETIFDLGSSDFLTLLASNKPSLETTYLALKYSELSSIAATPVQVDGIAVINVYYTRINYTISFNTTDAAGAASSYIQLEGKSEEYHNNTYKIEGVKYESDVTNL
ncbi:MAG: InlB B-repeat-containing protein, partial [Clostridiales Family XIII bacterium]|nr:InlB B-repeat-containing protein [Clostridiales Family XIII bacterium]